MAATGNAHRPRSEDTAMKTVLSIGAAVVCSLFVLALIPRQQGEQWIKPKVDVKSLVPASQPKLEATISLPAFSIKLRPEKTFTLPIPEGAYVGNFTVGHKRDIYFISVNELPQRRKTQLVRINVRNGESEEVSIPELADGLLINISLDKDGLLYGTVQSPSRMGAIIILTRT